jgi:hypothetical protein
LGLHEELVPESIERVDLLLKRRLREAPSIDGRVS